MSKTAEGRDKGFLFRQFPQNILIGTASDRYAGWIGQVYSPGKYEKGITRRRHKVRDQNFTEEVLPVESVAEYFEHFSLLEIDYTFYRPLLESNGTPSLNYRVLKNYRQQMKEGDLVNLKAPQMVIARKLRRSSGFVEKGNKGRHRHEKLCEKSKLEISCSFGILGPSSPANHLLGS